MSDRHRLCFLNGEMLPLADAKVSVLDRSFLFGDGVYEVIPVYDGQPFVLDSHLQRLANSLAAVHMRCAFDFANLVARLIEQNGGGDMAIYIQVSRGAPKERNHLIPAAMEATVFAMTQDFPAPSEKAMENGLSATICADFRWGRCDIKATSLLANVLLRQQAADQDADEAILERDGMITEGASSSVFALIDGTLRTPEDAPTLLPGTTRDRVIDVARDQGITVVSQGIGKVELYQAAEVWICSALRELLPVTRLDGRAVGDGLPGPVWKKVYRAFQIAKRTC